METTVNFELLAALAKQTSTNLSAKGSNERLIYKFQLNAKLSSKEQKDLRRKLRNERNNLCFDVCRQNKSLIESKKFHSASILNFLKFYKETYILNNFEIESLSSKNFSNEADKANVSFTLACCKLYLQHEKIPFASLSIEELQKMILK